MSEELEGEISKMGLDNDQDKFVTFTLSMVEENKKIKMKLEEKEEEIANCNKEVLTLQKILSTTQERLKVLEEVDEDERVKRMKEDGEKEVMEKINEDKIKKLMKEVDGLRDEVECCEKEVERVKENNNALTFKLLETNEKLKEKENEVILLVRDAHVMQEDNYQLQRDIGLMMKKMNKMAMQEVQLTMMQQENHQLQSRQRELLEEVEMLQGVVREAEDVLQRLKTTQHTTTNPPHNSLLMASVHASLGLDCSIDNITHLLNYNDGDEEEEDDDDDGCDDVTPQNSPMRRGRRMKKMKMDLMSEMMGACDDYVQSLEAMQQQLDDVIQERDHLRSVIESRGTMVDRSTSPITTNLPISGPNEITEELENELLSLLNQSLSTYKMTCQVAGEKVNGRAIEHVTGRRRDVMERRGKDRSVEQWCVDLFKMAASSCDLVRYSHRVVIRMSKQGAPPQTTHTPHQTLTTPSTPRALSTSSSPLKQPPSSVSKQPLSPSLPKRPSSSPWRHTTSCQCGATKHLQQLLQAKNEHVSLASQMVQANREAYNSSLEKIRKNFEEEKMELKKKIHDLESINKQLSSIHPSSIHSSSIHSSSIYPSSIHQLNFQQSIHQFHTHPHPTNQQPLHPHPTNQQPLHPHPTKPQPTESHPTISNDITPNHTHPYPTDQTLVDPRPTIPNFNHPHPTDQHPTISNLSTLHPTISNPTTPHPTDPNMDSDHDTLLKELQDTTIKLNSCEKERQTLNNLLLLAIRHKLKLIGLLDQHAIPYDLHDYRATNQSTRRNISPRKPMSPRKRWTGNGRSDSGFKPLLYPFKNN